jgi:hypothetical protein
MQQSNTFKHLLITLSYANYLNTRLKCHIL